MNRRFQLAVVASSTCVVVLLFSEPCADAAPPRQTLYTHLGVYSEVLSRIKADYVEEPDMKAVTAGAINGMLESLDPYASYLNADQYKQYLQSQAVEASRGRSAAFEAFGYMTVVDAMPGLAGRESRALHRRRGRVHQ